ncbi:uncharacterized protein PITG_08785 [Phytophthora infestans T30-4]|uniref:Uncharacterized protein n=1 Tax=Phytophthora infestans (strain T30-4) TaxID=403677 RepID=D0ND74_PHYIT|nr:uncharacterized protein PITG_08785 [Phytophthora infestans T30-4]EEY56031.1 conserved hypothetical protein [Phytophthora infestans T30-4]|eukprot:XP_002902861.1 conserved hypothetical protein [Phytophthora infestans T30-4]
MKLLGLLAAGLPVGALASSASLGLKDSLLADSRERTVSFASLPYDLPSSTLISEGIATTALKNVNANEYGHIGCTETSKFEDNGEVAVTLWGQWVNQVKATIANVAYVDDLKITFQSTMVPGACEERSEKTKQGLEDPHMVNQGGAPAALLADDVLPSDLERLEAFPVLGNIVNLANDDVKLSVKPIAVISFVTGEKSYAEVEKFEANAHVSKTFNFHICKSGTSCGGTFSNFIDLPEVVDLFMYNPFTVTRSLQCADLDDGVPVTYLDDFGARQCFCNCPAGYEIGENEYGHAACKKVVEDTCPCVWAECNGFKHKVTTNEPVCSFKEVASKWGLPVPFPTDGYVADKRDILSEGYKDPRITLTVEREQDAEYKGRDIRGAVGVGASYPLTFHDVVGLYPKASSFTPVMGAAHDTTTHHKVVTWKGLPDKANGLVNQYFDFATKAKNDACSVDNRCDKESFSRRDFFEKDYTDHDCSQAHQCFNKDKVLQDLLASQRTKTNPLLTQGNGCDNTDAPVPIGQCTRCCKMDTSLKEWWTDYRCGADYDVRSCEGDSDQTCQFSQCLVMNGYTMATVTASITADAKAETESVLAQVEDEAYQTVTQVHRSLDCTSFGGTDGECEFRAKLSELIDTTQTLMVPSTGQATDYVFWRYKLVSDGESWQLWKTGKQESYGEVTYDNDDVLTLSNPETKITIEAWTQCGLVRRFFFYVHLHVNSPVSVCEKFNNMWYQTSVSRLPIGAGMCAYPGSDFAELTFDFHPNAGLQYSREELRMKVAKVECTGALEGRLPIDILSVTQESPEIVTRFAVTMLNKATTEAATDFHVECVFTYTKYSGATATETCKRDFSISDCKGPTFDTPNSVCEYEACAGNDLAGLYEACGGTVVKADDKCTIVESGEKSCCQGCDSTEVTCTALLDLPNANADLMRCEPSAGGGAYSSPSTSYGAVLLTETAQEHPAATALFGATALIAVVALVVVRRRAVAVYSAQTVDDAYYPLLH